MKRTNNEKQRSVTRHKSQKRIRRMTAGLFLILCTCLTFGTFFVYARENRNETSYTYYKSIEIQPGDTLWDIAEDTMPSGYDSTADYVEVLKDMNGLTADDIQAGHDLIIAYSGSEPIG